MNRSYSRRDFLKFGALFLPGLALAPGRLTALAEPDSSGEGLLGRVTIESISVYSQAWDEASIVFQRFRDELVHLYSTVVSEHGPGYNPVWYRVWGGYIHSARIQLVKRQLNTVAASLPEGGQVGEVTVPVSQPFHYNGKDTWTPLYPLYYELAHWITDIVDGPDGSPWYQITEAWSRDKYYVPAEGVRLIPPEEMTPLSPDVPGYKKRIEISIDQQTLKAYEDDQEVFKTKVSTGLFKEVTGELPWKTPTGEHHVMSKMPSQRMGDDAITSDVSGYVLPGVPWVSYFHETGVALHGCYWHNNYGSPMSHGCVNMRPEEAKWIFRWTTPAPVEAQHETRGFGTLVSIH